MTEPQFRVRTSNFEGPLDLLLSLIEKRKLLINDISLSKVANDYIDYVKSVGNFPLDMTANFILIASTLLLIKSKSLLPTLTLSEEEEGSIEDLENRLKIYKKFKDLSKNVSSLFGAKIIFSRLANRNFPIVFSPDKKLNLKTLISMLGEVIANFPVENLIPKAAVKRIMSLEEMIVRLTKRIESNIKMSFSEFANDHGKGKYRGSKHRASGEARLHIIVGFLALLELIKRGLIEARQSSISEDIEIETQTVGIPKY